MGKDNDESQSYEGVNNYANLMADIAKENYANTAQARQGAINNANNIYSGNYKPSQSPAYASGRNNLEDSYSAAKQDILAQTAKGGGQSTALGDLSVSRAKGLTDLTSDIYADEYNKAYQVGTGSTATTQSGLSSATSSLSNVAAAESSAKNGMMGDFGTAAGSYLGSKE